MTEIISADFVLEIDYVHPIIIFILGFYPQLSTLYLAQIRVSSIHSHVTTYNYNLPEIILFFKK